MTHILPVMSETFLRLRRDRIFLPVAMVGIGLLLLSGVASFWSIEEFYKMLYDLGTTVFHLTGAMVAIFWGTKIIQDSRQEGSVEVQLAAPIRRTEWVVGKYLGLALALGFLAVLFLVGWQLIYWGYGIGWMGLEALGIFTSLSMSWMVMAAASVLIATTASPAVALFSAVWLLICGLLSQPILQSLAPETPEAIRLAVTWFAGLWDLHYFNLSTAGQSHMSVSFEQFLDRLAYGFALITAMIAMSCLIFHKRDIRA